MKASVSGFALLVCALLTGCASKPQLPVPLQDTAFKSGANKVGIIMSEVPKVDTEFPGASCLLCLAAASVANSALTDHTRTLSAEDLPKVKDQVAEILRNKGVTPVVINEALDFKKLPDFDAKGDNISRKDFASLRGKYGVDKLIVIQVNSVGIQRPYASYVPVGDPKAQVNGYGALVNLSNNSYEWYAQLDASKGTDKWDEGPNFPGLTNAYYQAIEAFKDHVTEPLAK